MGGARGLAMSRAGQSLQRSLISVLENNREGNRPSCPPPQKKVPRGRGSPVWGVPRGDILEEGRVGACCWWRTVMLLPVS